MKTKLTRRRVLAGIATVGTAGALGSAGTYALFSDTARTQATFTSGSLHLRVHYDTTYNGKQTQTNSGIIDGTDSTALPDYADLKPGDSGEMQFCFEVTTNPAYLWVCGDLSTSSDLSDAIEATVRYCDADGTSGTVIGDENRSLSDVFAELANGLPLDYDGTDANAGDQTAYESSSSSNSTTGPCLCIEWELPSDVGNEVQNDELGFDLTFHAVQARHNDGTNNPCGDTSGGGTTTTGGSDETTTASGGGSSNQPGISFIAFCDFDGNPNSLKPKITVSGTNDGGDATEVQWSTNKTVGHIALKSGNQDAGSGKPDHWDSFFDNFYPNSKSGTVAVGQGDPALKDQTPSNPCPGENFVKIESGDFE